MTKRIALFALFWGLWGVLGCPTLGYGGTNAPSPHSVYLDALAEAVYQAEGGARASVPYGLIYSKWCKDEPGHCRYYAKEIMRVHLTRCKTGEDAIECIGRQYCPPKVHKKNANWVSNVRYYYQRSING